MTGESQILRERREVIAAMEHVDGDQVGVALGLRVDFVRDVDEELVEGFAQCERPARECDTASTVGLDLLAIDQGLVDIAVFDQVPLRFNVEPASISSVWSIVYVPLSVTVEPVTVST